MIIINKYDAPKTCGDCFALDERGDYPMCRITGETRGYNFDVDFHRMDKCPIENGAKKALVKKKQPPKKLTCWCCQKEYYKEDLRAVHTKEGEVRFIVLRGYDVPLCEACLRLFMLVVSSGADYRRGRVIVDGEAEGWEVNKSGEVE